MNNKNRYLGVATLFCGLACLAFASSAAIDACKSGCDDAHAFEAAGAAADRDANLALCQSDYNNSDHGPEAELAKIHCENGANGAYTSEMSSIDAERDSCKSECNLIG